METECHTYVAGRSLERKYTVSDCNADKIQVRLQRKSRGAASRDDDRHVTTNIYSPRLHQDSSDDLPPTITFVKVASTSSLRPICLS